MGILLKVVSQTFLFFWSNLGFFVGIISELVVPNDVSKLVEDSVVTDVEVSVVMKFAHRFGWLILPKILPSSI